ncbi:hypothetical protein D9619_001683 [Psilocybe cf. subviscida]|uniref:F-box domain-containing protein n=1 Tax=Psilocybe cf. subviscida TaxID=2480587 RepID=A0A8H5F2F8_9AGAR|nr:hypothetical protein D9619_001683 [Psilocybe cf. subviscida]
MTHPEHLDSTVETIRKTPFQATSPINALPPEILSIIFFLAYPKNQIPQRAPFEVLLSHVSKYWRNVAQGTASLWTTITIRSPHSLGWLPVYLERAGKFTSFDLTIDVYRWDKLTRKSKRMRQRFAQEVADNILPVFGRVEKLTILCYQEVTVDAFQSHIKNVSADRLRVFEVRFDPSRDDGHEGHALFTKGAPNLRYLKTTFADCLPPPSALRNLTTMYLNLGPLGNSLTYPAFVDILKATRSVRYLTIAHAMPSFITSWPVHLAAPDFTLPNLECLRLLENGYMAAKFLLSVSAPNLESLWLHCSLDNFGFFFDAPQMQPTTTASTNTAQPAKFARLRYFTAFNDIMYSAVKFATVFPNITHLHLPFANFYHSNQLQAALIFHWPLLRTIVLTLVRETKWTRLTGALEIALPARRQDNHPVDTILVDKDYRLKLDTLVPRIDTFVDIVDLTETNYKEPWWSKDDEAGFF